MPNNVRNPMASSPIVDRTTKRVLMGMIGQPCPIFRCRTSRLRHWANLGSEFPSDLPVQRIRTAAAQRDREHDQPPKQRIFVAAGRPAEALRQMREGDDQHLDRDRSGEEAREY